MPRKSDTHSHIADCSMFLAKMLCKIHGPKVTQLRTQTHIHMLNSLTALLYLAWDYPGQLTPETNNQSGFTEAKDNEWAIIYKSACITQTQTCQYPTTHFYRLDALYATHPTSSKHWRQILYYSICNKINFAFYTTLSGSTTHLNYAHFYANSWVSEMTFLSHNKTYDILFWMHRPRTVMSR